MSEDEAKTKWCPFVRIGNNFMGVTTVNRQEARPSTKCIGSACMAWRWREEPEAQPTYTRGTLGYCGLAGKP